MTAPHDCQPPSIHPVTAILKDMAGYDFAVLSHYFLPHGRDYSFIIEKCIDADPGRFELVFTHCVRLEYQTKVRDDVWAESWSDEFTDYQRWQAAGEPEGYVWGTNWSIAYPGLFAVEQSPIADECTRRVGRNFYEATLETDRFFMRLIFHEIRRQKLSDQTSTISQVIVPLPPKSS